ncbi:MAG: MFS transporter [Hydrogenobacter sp.]
MSKKRLLIPSSQAILFNLFPPERRGTAMGFYAMAVAFAPGLGPTMGGYMVKYFSWRWIFYMNVSVVVILLPVAYFMLPEMGNRAKVPFNLPSFVFLSISSISFIVFLSKGESWGWFYSMKTFVAFCVAVFSFLLFVLSELLGKNKLTDYSIFKEPNYLYAVITFVTIYGFVFFQVIYIMPIYLESLKNVPTFQAGLTFLWYAFLLATFALIRGRLSDRIEPKLLLLISQSVLFLTLFFFLSHIDYYTPRWKVAFFFAL